MKRFLFLIAVLAITLFATTSLVMAQAPFTSGISSAPNLVNFQGKLTLPPLGNPVPNGPHTFVFRIFDLPVGGVMPWSEGPLGIVTTGGLFTHQLGSSTPLPPDLFEDFDSLYLEVEADGGVITPRTRLTSSPYSRVAGDLEARLFFNDSVYARTRNDFCGFSTYSVFDGIERVRLWGCGYGEIFLFDGTGSVNASIGGPSGGGYLILSGGPGASFLSASTPGDGSVNLPTDAINAGEMLNEAGIASGFSLGTVTLTSTDVNLDSAIITCPSAGYVVILASAYYDPTHTLATKDLARVSISKTSAVLDFTSLANITTAANDETSSDSPMPVALHRVDVIASAGVQRYYFVADEFLGNTKVSRARITAMFFPTNYGTVDITIASRPGGGETVLDASRADGGYTGEGQGVEVSSFTVEAHNARLQAEQAKQVAELEARIKKLEAAAKQGKQQAVEPNR